MYEITGSTTLTALLGSPVKHSISPMMHNESFRLLNLDYSYLAFDVSPSDLKSVVDAFKIMNVRGYNLTMPHKNMIIDYLDEISDASKMSMSVNTVLYDGDKLYGTTTDGIGFWQAMHYSGFDLNNSVVTILGFGGAAKAIIAQGALDGAKSIRVFKRKNSTFDEASKMIANIANNSCANVSIHDLNDLNELKSSIKSSDILINATSVGMSPNDNECLIPDKNFFHKDLFVSDIIYSPSKTRLIQMAQEAGCRYANGLYMLLYQGAASFKIWTGQDMPVDIIKEKYFDKGD